MRLSDAIKSYSSNNSLPSTSAISHINSDGKTLMNSNQYDCNDQNIVSDMYTRLTINGFQEDIPNQNDSYYGINSNTNRPIASSTEYIETCKNQSMVATLQDDFYNTNKNSDIAKTELRKKIEYVKKLSENRKNKNINTQLVNEDKSNSGFISVSMK